jgi:hypothetical protein
VTGAIRQPNGTDVPVSGTLWLAAAEQPGELTSWGGWVKGKLAIDGAIGHHDLLIPGRPTASILVTSHSFGHGRIVFSGNSPYP